MTEDSGIVRDKKIYELTDVYDERSGHGRRSTDGKSPQQIIVIDGRGYERVKSNGQNIHELTEVIEDNPFDAQFNDAVMKRATEIVEKIAREIFPEIAERIIKEEINKIKRINKEHQD